MKTPLSEEKQKKVEDYLKQPETLEVIEWLHCKMCTDEMPITESPREYQRMQLGITKEGLLAVCVRHNAPFFYINLKNYVRKAD